jgi:phage tail sheath protein FI
MAFQLSPGVNVSEIDLTTVIPSVATTIGGFAGNFNWGPVDEITSINNELQLVERFGKPDGNTSTSFFTAANFLSYGSNLKLVRSVGAGAKNAVDNGTGPVILNETDYTDNHSSGSGTQFFAAKYPGTLANGIRIEICDANNTVFNAWTYKNQFDTSPSASDYASLQIPGGSSNDEIHIIVLDAAGKITGTANTVLEKYGFVSKASDAKNTDGTSNYYKDVINNKSKYLWWLKHPSIGTDWGTTVDTQGEAGFECATAIIGYTLQGGVDAAPATSNVQTSFALFNNSDTVDVSLMMAGPYTDSTTVNNLISIVDDRKDCMLFVSPPSTNVIDNAGSEALDISNLITTLTPSSYVVIDSAWKYQYDKYNDVYRWIPLNADIAGLCARTDIQRDPWFSPAGLNRGQIKNVVKLSWNPKKSERDAIYKAGINPVVTFPGEGTILYGDKTFQNRPSAFDRINVRRLFLILEKTIAKAARSTLFEFNDEFTRAQFVNLVEPFLRDIQGRRGIYDYRVVCDTTNNTPEVIDQNQFVGDIYIKPARSINFIQLNFVAVRTGVAFNEIVGKF